MNKGQHATVWVTLSLRVSCFKRQYSKLTPLPYGRNQSLLIQVRDHLLSLFFLTEAELAFEWHWKVACWPLFIEPWLHLQPSVLFHMWSTRHHMGQQCRKWGQAGGVVRPKTLKTTNSQIWTYFNEWKKTVKADEGTMLWKKAFCVTEKENIPITEHPQTLNTTTHPCMLAFTFICFICLLALHFLRHFNPRHQACTQAPFH